MYLVEVAKLEAEGKARSKVAQPQRCRPAAAAQAEGSPKGAVPGKHPVHIRAHGEDLWFVSWGFGFRNLGFGV